MFNLIMSCLPTFSSCITNPFHRGLQSAEGGGEGKKKVVGSGFGGKIPIVVRNHLQGTLRNVNIDVIS